MFADLFSFEYYDHLEDTLLFCDCILLKPIGLLPVGLALSCITVNIVLGVISLENGSTVLGRHNLSAVIGEDRWNVLTDRGSLQSVSSSADLS